MANRDGKKAKPNYRWPWLVGAVVVLGIVLAVIWMRVAVNKVERERDFNSPLPSSAPVK